MLPSFTRSLSVPGVPAAVALAVLCSCSSPGGDDGATSCGPDERAVGSACVPTAFDSAWMDPVPEADLVDEGGRTFLKGRLLVGLWDASTTREAATAAFAAEGGTVDGGFPAIGFYRVRFAAAATMADLDAKAATLRALPEVEFVLRDELLPMEAADPKERPKDSDDEKIGDQVLAWKCTDDKPVWAPAGPNATWAYRDTGVYAAWDAIYRENPVLSPVVVGVVDSPVETKVFGSLPLVGYSDLEWILSEGQEVSTDPHGTLVAAVIGAPNDGDGMNGILSGLGCIRYDLSPQGVIGKWSRATGTPGRSGIEAVLIGMAKAVRSGARVVNLSLGAGNYDDAQAEQHRIVTSLYAKVFAKAPDVLFVAAAGNDMKDASRLAPASAAATAGNVISVGAIGPDGKASVWRKGGSNTGPGVNIAAPGTDVLTTDPNGGLSLCEGTSLAAPVVSGVAGLLFAIDKDLTGAKARQILVKAATPGGDPSVSGLRLNAAKAVTDLMATLPKDRLGKGTCRPPDEEPPPQTGRETKCPIGDEYCTWCSGPSAGPVDLVVPGADPDYPKARLEMGWKSATQLSNFEVSIRDPATGAFLETGATNVAIEAPVLGFNTNVKSASVTRKAVSVTLSRITEDSAFVAGSFGVQGTPTLPIKTVTVDIAFAEETADVEVTAVDWTGKQATARFTAVYQLGSYCP
ncbi:MAG: S8 family serine peptidase [Deltaproteobacteria bacterium]|nr:S8 family serine peptidase [Deltaproteobacteria bacterium]